MARSPVQRLNSKVRSALRGWLRSTGPVCAATQPVDQLQSLMNSTWSEIHDGESAGAADLDERLRSAILSAGSTEVSIFTPLLLHVVSHRLRGWKTASKFLPHLRCRCPQAQAALALLSPNQIPPAAAHLDLSWPSAEPYAEYASFWNWSSGDRGIASLADLLKLQILDTKGHDRFKNLKVFWEQRSLPLVGPRLWSRLCPEVRLALLSHLPLNTLLEESFAQSLEDRFANVRKGLAAYLGVPVIERLRVLDGHSTIMGRLKVVAVNKELNRSSSRAAAMDDPDLRVSISNISRADDPRIAAILASKDPHLRAWAGIIRERYDIMADLNRLPLATFASLIDLRQWWLLRLLRRPLCVNGRSAMETFFKRLIRLGRVQDLLPGGSLTLQESPSAVISVFMGLWKRWRPGLTAEQSAKLFSQNWSHSFFKASLLQSGPREELLRVLSKLPASSLIDYLDRGEWYFDKVPPMASSLSALCKHAGSRARVLVRRVFENGTSDDPEDACFFWVMSSSNFSRLMDALDGHLGVERARELLGQWIDYLGARQAPELLRLRLSNGRRLGEYVLRWSKDWEDLEYLVANGGASWCRMMYERDPVRHFYSYFSRAGLRGVLPAAFRNKEVGALVDQIVDPGELVKLTGWVRRRYADCPTAAIAFETALLIGVSLAPALHHFAIHRRTGSERAGLGRSFESLYREKRIPKKRGGSRILKIPSPLLKHVQRKILVRALDGMKLPESVHGFRSGRNLLTNATPHAGKEIVVNADIRDFFPNTRRNPVFLACLNLAGGKISAQAAGFIADLCCQDGVLPMGAPTSPALANLVLGRVDRSLEKACRNKGVDYTRYADDLTFSGGREAVKMLGFATRLLQREGYELHPEKVNIFRRGRRQMVTGLAVNERPTLPRALRRSIRAAVHAAANGRSVRWKGAPASSHVLHGLLGHLAMTRPGEAREHRTRLERCGYFGNEEARTLPQTSKKS